MAKKVKKTIKAKRKVDVRPKCIECGKSWMPPEGVDAQYNACGKCWPSGPCYMCKQILTYYHYCPGCKSYWHSACETFVPMFEHKPTDHLRVEPALLDDCHGKKCNCSLTDSDW